MFWLLSVTAEPGAVPGWQYPCERVGVGVILSLPNVMHQR